MLKQMLANDKGSMDLPLKTQLEVYQGHDQIILVVTRPQVPCVTQNGSKELDLRKWLETWCRFQLPALKGVEWLCWKLRD
jgi:hypothetical protein